MNEKKLLANERKNDLIRKKTISEDMVMKALEICGFGYCFNAIMYFPPPSKTFRLVDFRLSKPKILIEVDGDSHNFTKTIDVNKDRVALIYWGYKTFRIKNKDVHNFKELFSKFLEKNMDWFLKHAQPKGLATINRFLLGIRLGGLDVREPGYTPKQEKVENTLSSIVSNT